MRNWAFPSANPRAATRCRSIASNPNLSPLGLVFTDALSKWYSPSKWCMKSVLAVANRRFETRFGRAAGSARRTAAPVICSWTPVPLVPCASAGKNVWTGSTLKAAPDAEASAAIDTPRPTTDAILRSTASPWYSGRNLLPSPPAADDAGAAALHRTGNRQPDNEKGGRRRGPPFALAPRKGSWYLSTSASAAPSRSVEVATSCAPGRGCALTLAGLTRHPDGVDEPASPQPVRRAGERRASVRRPQAPETASIAGITGG